MERNNSDHMTERERMMDLLNSQKQLMSLYALGISEASCPKLRNLLGGLFQEVANDQYRLWDLLNKKGYYPVEQAEQQKLQQAQQKANQTKQELN